MGVAMRRPRLKRGDDRRNVAVRYFGGGGPMASKAMTKTQALAKAKELLAKVPMIDGHNDLPWVIRQRTGAKGDVAGYDLRKLHNDGDTDIPRLRKGQVAGQVFAAFIPSMIRSGVVDESAEKMPPLWNQRTPPAMIVFQSKSPTFSRAAASLLRL